MSVKKTLASIASYALVGAVALGVGGTLAFQNDETVSADNKWVVGDIEIEQLEYQRADKESHINDGAEKDDLIPFVQDKMIMPAVPLNNQPSDYTAEGTDLFNWGVYSAGGNGLWDDSKLSNVMDKFVFVKNTGENDCYYRTVIAFECPEGATYGEAGQGADFMLNVNGNERFTWTPEDEDVYTTIDGVRYLLKTATYNEVLKPGETSRPSLLQIVMTHHADNVLVDSLGDEYEIKVVSQAVQLSGFEGDDAPTAAQMLERAFGEVTSENNPWTAVPVADAAHLVEAVENGKNITLTADIDLGDQQLVIAKDSEVTINLSEFDITQKKAQTEGYSMIVNKGTLTIDGTTGVISYADTSTYSADNGYVSNTIQNLGVLNINGGTIENVSSDNVKSNGYPHAIDVYQGSTTNITGGTVKSANYDCIRMFCNSATLPTTVNISGGNIINRVSFQNPSEKMAGYGVLNITGGTFTTTDGVNANVRLLNFGSDVSNMTATITGGTFDKGVKTQNFGTTPAKQEDWLTIGKGVTIRTVD